MHPEILTASQSKVLRKLGPLATERGFYLAGGTALALQLGHRRSRDFDWFCRKRRLDPNALAEDLSNHGRLTSKEIATRTLHCKVDRVPVSFLSYPYRSLERQVRFADFGIRLASVRDICCMKLAAVGDRGSKKDFIDIYAIGKASGMGIGEMLELYKAKYDSEDVSHLLFALAYYEDADAEETPELLTETKWGQVKSTISRWVNDYYIADR